MLSFKYLLLLVCACAEPPPLFDLRRPRQHHPSNNTEHDRSHNEQRRPLVFGTMTTTPVRLKEIEGDLGHCLRLLLAMPRLDRLYLNVPWSYELRGASISDTKSSSAAHAAGPGTNITLPAALLSLAKGSQGRLHIIRCKDYGPATKLLPTLLQSNHNVPPDSILITFDDDRLYTAAAVDTLVNNSLARPDTAISIAAWSVSILSSTGRRGFPRGPDFYTAVPPQLEGLQYVKEGRVDLINGFYGVAYRKNMFFEQERVLDHGRSHSRSQSHGHGRAWEWERGGGVVIRDLFNYSASPALEKHCKMVDDIWFSGHLERLGVPRIVVGRTTLEIRAHPSGLSNMGVLSLEGVRESARQNEDNVRCAKAMRDIWGIWTGKVGRGGAVNLSGGIRMAKTPALVIK